MPNILVVEPQEEIKEMSISPNLLSRWSFFRGYKNYGDRCLWIQCNSKQDDYDEIRIRMVNGDSLWKQKQTVIVYKATSKKKLLPLSVADIDSIRFFVDCFRTFGGLKHLLDSYTFNKKLPEALVLLKEAVQKIQKIDLRTQEYTNAKEFIGLMFQPFLELVRIQHYVMGQFVLCDWITGYRELEDTIAYFQGYTEYPSEEIKDFSPDGKEFLYHLHTTDCFRRLTGNCSLELTEKEAQMYDRDNNMTGESAAAYCRLLRDSILANGVHQPVELQHNTVCGHYSFTDGQHRTCIAKRLKLQIPAEIALQQTYCRMCSQTREGDEPESDSFID